MDLEKLAYAVRTAAGQEGCQTSKSILFAFAEVIEGATIVDAIRRSGYLKGTLKDEIDPIAFLDGNGIEVKVGHRISRHDEIAVWTVQEILKFGVNAKNHFGGVRYIRRDNLVEYIICATPVHNAEAGESPMIGTPKPFSVSKSDWEALAKRVEELECWPPHRLNYSQAKQAALIPGGAIVRREAWGTQCRLAQTANGHWIQDFSESPTWYPVTEEDRAATDWYIQL